MQTSLDYPYVCPKVDDCINKTKSLLYDKVYDLYLEQSPLLVSLSHLPEEILEEIQSTVDDMMYNIDGYFEDLRTEFENMRNTADDQLREFGEALEDSTSELNSLKETIGDGL